MAAEAGFIEVIIAVGILLAADPHREKMFFKLFSF